MTETQKKRHSPLTWVPSAYFAMGMPFVILNMVCVLMFKGLGIEDSQIALWTSVIMFPWTIKFLWSPFLEIFKTKKFFVVTTQLISGVGFGLVALALHLDHFFAISIAILAVIALSGATHDIALDGLYMAELSKTDQAKYIGWQGAFYNLAKLIATGLLVYIAGVLINHYEASGATNQEAALPAWTVIMLACCAILVLLSIPQLPTPRQANRHTTATFPSLPPTSHSNTSNEQNRLNIPFSVTNFVLALTSLKEKCGKSTARLALRQNMAYNLRNESLFWGTPS